MTDVAEWGLFVDIGCEVQGLVPLAAVPYTCAPLGRGDPVTVYVTEKDVSRGRLTFALEPRAAARRFWHQAEPDGLTPYRGTVTGFDAYSYYFDLGFGVPGVLRKDMVPPGTVVGEVGSSMQVRRGPRLPPYLPRCGQILKCRIGGLAQNE